MALRAWRLEEARTRRGANFRRMRYRPVRMPESPFATSSPRALAGHDSALASAALGRLAGILGEDAIFVLGSGARDAKEALDGVLQRRGPAYAAAVQGQPHTRMTAGFDAVGRRDGARAGARCRRRRGCR